MTKEELEKENAELKAHLQKKINTTTVSDYPYSALKLEEAKRIIQNFVWWHTSEDRGSIDSNGLVERAEQFLKEIEK